MQSTGIKQLTISNIQIISAIHLFVKNRLNRTDFSETEY